MLLKSFTLSFRNQKMTRNGAMMAQGGPHMAQKGPNVASSMLQVALAQLLWILRSVARHLIVSHFRRKVAVNCS